MTMTAHLHSLVPFGDRCSPRRAASCSSSPKQKLFVFDRAVGDVVERHRVTTPHAPCTAMAGGFIPEEEDVREGEARTVRAGLSRAGPIGPAGSVVRTQGHVPSSSSSPPPTVRPSSSRSCSLRAPNRCTECNAAPPCKDLYEAYGICVCGSCRRALKLITKSDAKQQYLLSDSDMQGLKWMERKNPQRSSWTAMKLYLESSVQEVSYGKYGGREGLEEEARRRMGRKLDKRVQEREEKVRREARRVKRVKEIREEIAAQGRVDVDGVELDEEEI